MSAFHRVDDITTMPALRFINLALRLVAYKGVLRALIEHDQTEEAAGHAPARPATQAAPVGQNRTVDSTPEALRTDPAFAGQIEYKGA